MSEERDMARRFGTESAFVRAETYLTHSEMVEFFGERCEDFEPYCCACQEWLRWNETGKARMLFTRSEILGLARKDKPKTKKGAKK